MRIYPKNVAIFIICVVGLPMTMLWLSMSAKQGTQLGEEVIVLRNRLELVDTLNKNKDRELKDLHARFQQIVQDFKSNPNVSHKAMDVGQSDSGAAAFGHLNESLKYFSGSLLDVTDIQAPSIYHYLPHLRGNNQALKPAFKLSQRRKKVSLVFGVPTIKRSKQEYLVDTVRSLLDNLNDEERSDSLIVIIVAEPWDLNYVKSVATKIQANFKAALSDGVLEIIAPPPDFYPNLDNLKENFGDSKERVKWRTKQNLDFAFLMMYCRSRGDYYIQLEDDIVTKPGYVSSIKKFAIDQNSADWLVLEFSRLGFIGKLFRTTDLSMVAEFFLMFHKDKPIDWLLDHILYVKACNPEKDNKHCTRSKQELMKRYKPSLFQHTGLHSSLTGKLQKIKDRDFGKGGLHRAHVNPAAATETSLKIYQKYSLQRAYNGETFFWALLPQAKDYVLFKFNSPVDVESYLFKSGNLEHTTDKFFNTSIDILPESTPTLNSTEVGLYKKGEDNYYQIGKFDDSGVAQGPVSKNFGKLSALRLTVHMESENWVILSEIFVKQRPAPKR